MDRPNCLNCLNRDMSIHSDHFYSASSRPLLLRSAPDTARILCRSFTPKRHIVLYHKYARCLRLFDLGKAFDTVDHSIFICKLARSGALDYFVFRVPLNIVLSALLAMALFLLPETFEIRGSSRVYH